jgi:hypothetical protein
MKYKIATMILAAWALLATVNAIRFYNYLEQFKAPKPCVEKEEVERLRMEKMSWLQREEEFLKQNSALVIEINELKMQTKKPLIIYRNVQKNKIDDIASESYTSTLLQRYGAANQ